MKPPFDLALLTGASGGLGQALTKILQQQNIPLIRTGRDNSKCELDLIADLINPQPILDFIQAKSPDLVINNAGFTLYGDALSHPQQEIFEVNAAAVLKITLAAAKRLKEQNKPGIILNISSAAALLPFPGMATYSAAKAFVASFSQSFDTEMKPYGIRILTTLPGQIDTSFASTAAGKPCRTNHFSMYPEKAATLIWQQIKSKNPYQVIDWRTRWLVRLSHLLPKNVVEEILYKEIIKRTM